MPRWPASMGSCTLTTYVTCNAKCVIFFRWHHPNSKRLHVEDKKSCLINISRKNGSFVLGDCSLLLPKFDQLLVNFEPFPLSHVVHILPRRILTVGFFTEMQQLLLGPGLPGGVDLQHLPVREDQLGHRQTACLLPQLVAEVEAFCRKVKIRSFLWMRAHL